MRYSLVFRLVFLLTLLASAAAGPSLRAQEETSDGPEEAFGEEVTVTATRSPRPVAETPGGVAVVTAEEIDRRLAAGSADLVRYVPGVYVDGDPTRLGPSGFNIRGIGGNRVLTRIDGIPVAEQFAFGPLAVPQYSLDVEALSRAEVVKSAGSALYGSDALGGVVSLLTKDPDSLLAGGANPAISAETGYHGAREEISANLGAAVRRGRWQASLFAARREGSELDNQGTVTTADHTRTAPNPQDREAANGIAKLVWLPSESSRWEATVELFDGETATDALSLQGVDDLGPQFGPGVTYRIDTASFDALDSQRRDRLSLEHSWQSGGRGLPFDRLEWRVYGVRSDTEQETEELRRTTIGGGPFGPGVRSTEAERSSLLTFEQDSVGGEIQLQKGLLSGHGDHLLTYGVTALQDDFDMVRNQVSVDPATGETLPPGTGSIYPTKYFPATRVREIGAYVQDELDLLEGRLRLIPGLRIDDYRMDPDEDDAIYLSGNPGTPPPEGLSETAVSPRLGVVGAVSARTALFAQYARGFRAPPYSAVNNGFTNPTFGYVTLPNPDLEPETSDNLELGLRGRPGWGSYDVVLFENRYDDFIETVTLGVDPMTGLLQFQPRNVAEARIRGVELATRVRLDRSWSALGTFAYVEGENRTTGEPLDSVAPPQLVLGLSYGAPSGHWGGELLATVADDKDPADLDDSAQESFAPAGYEVLDLTAWIDLGRRLRLTAGVFNLTDETYWRWSTARGLPADSTVLDRYTSPGRHAAVSLSFHR